MLLAGSLLPSTPAAAWPDSYVGRLQAEAVLQTLNGQLLASDSATETLLHWCADHRLASPAVIVARRLRGDDKPADAGTRQLLRAGPAVAVRYRHVQLMCGPHVLSEADNWYLPGALTADMNRRLDETDEPFGAVVRPLKFHRRTLAAVLLYRPGHGLPRNVLRHRAVLETEDGAAFSVVVETYTREVLAFEAARAR